MLTTPLCRRLVENAGETIDACLDAGIPALVLFWGDAAPYVERVRGAGAALLIQVG